MEGLAVGVSCELRKIVEFEDTAAHLGSGAVEVFATPAMILMMEEAARDAVSPFLDEGFTTVGTAVDIKHLAASPLGVEITTTACLVEIDGRRLVFEVESKEGQKLIGSGRHERAVIDINRFMAKLAGGK